MLRASAQRMLFPAGPAVLRRALVLVALAGFIQACGGAEQGAAATAADQAGLPVWDEHQREVFGDNIDPAAVGLTLEGPSPRSDVFLRERAQTADVVARVRVNTVTIDSIGDESSYHLGVQVGYPPITIPRVSDRSFELNIRATSRGFAIAKAFDARLRGMTFIAFIRRFVGEAGELELHWHLAPDTTEVAAAVKEAVVLGELSAP